MAPKDEDALAAEIRRVDGNHDLGAGALAEALLPFILEYGYGYLGPDVSGPAVVVSGFKIGTHIFIGEQERVDLPQGGWRWACSCGAKGTWTDTEGFGWYRWLSHVMSKYHTNNWPLYHEARLLQGDR